MIHIPDSSLPKELRKRELIIFIDGNHLFHRTKYWYGTHDLNIIRLSNMISTINRELLEIRYYYSPFIEQVNKRSYLDQDIYVKRLGQNTKVKLITGHYLKKPIVQSQDILEKIKNVLTHEELHTYIEKETDVHIATDMVSLAH